MQNALIAYCGLYCGACSFRVAFEENDRNHITCMPVMYDHLKNEALEFCLGCRMESQCWECGIRDCATRHKVDYCSECDKFPCQKLIDFNNDGKPHHSKVLENLNLLKAIGEDKWLELQRKKWECVCGAKYSWYLKNCKKCHQ